MFISPNLRFHIAEIETPDEAMKNLNNFFGIKNEIRAHQLENELLTLPLKFFCPSSRPLDFSWKALRLRKKMVALSIPFLLS